MSHEIDCNNRQILGVAALGLAAAGLTTSPRAFPESVGGDMRAAADFGGGGPRGLRVTAQSSDLKRLVAHVRMWCASAANLPHSEMKTGQTEHILAPWWRLRAPPRRRARCDHAADDTPILKERSQWRRP